jgi:bifunctional DNase/RNase
MDLKQQQRLQYLEEELKRYMPIFLDKKKHFRGIRHEDSLSELRYTEYMVYKDIIEGLIKEIEKLKKV